jgi:hypothetical protein
METTANAVRDFSPLCSFYGLNRGVGRLLEATFAEGVLVEGRYVGGSNYGLEAMSPSATYKGERGWVFGSTGRASAAVVGHG